MKIGLIGCVKKKKKGLYKVRDLYISDLFKKSLKFALKEYNKVYVLSAKYGLLGLDTEIEDYETTLNNMRKAERKLWYEMVIKQIKETVDEEDELYILAGKKYHVGIIPSLKNKINLPLGNMPIGKRLKWLDKQL